MTTTLHPPDLPRSTDFRNHEEGPCGTVNGHPKVDDDMFGDAQHPPSCPLEGCGGISRVSPSRSLVRPVRSVRLSFVKSDHCRLRPVVAQTVAHPGMRHCVISVRERIVDAALANCWEWWWTSRCMSIVTRRGSRGSGEYSRNSFQISQRTAHFSSEVGTNRSVLSKIIGMIWQNLPNDKRQACHRPPA